jgi:Family of unknown function (DUF6941)
MQVESFLADTVQASDGKLHALGMGWRVIQASAFPARHDRIGLGVIVRTGPAESGAHTLSISLLGPDGAPRSFGQGTSFEARFATPDGEGTATLALNLDGLLFESEGTYTLVLAVDGNEFRREPFRVQTRPEPPASEFRTGVYL